MNTKTYYINDKFVGRFNIPEDDYKIIYLNGNIYSDLVEIFNNITSAKAALFDDLVRNGYIKEKLG